MDHSPIPWLTFVILVEIHAVLLGLPTIWILASQGLLNRLTVIVSGIIIGAAPIAIILSKASGPGLHYGQSVIIGAVSGAAVGFVFLLFFSVSIGSTGELRSSKVKEENQSQARHAPEIRMTSANSPFFIRRPVIGFINLAGSDGALLAQRDMDEIGALFPAGSSLESERFTKCNVLFLYCTLESSGKISERPYSLRDVIYATGAHVVVVALDVPPDVVTSKEFGSFMESKSNWPANIVITLNRNGDAFGKFFKSLFQQMHAGKTMPSAWVKLAPQGPVGGAENPGTVALLEAGHIAFAAS